MARVLIFGGSFNPVHYGHLRLAVEGLEQFGFDQTWLLPSGTPPHRQAYSQLPEQRLHMLERAIVGQPRLHLCDHEISGKIVTNYTVDTIQALQALYPEHNFSFLTGLDALYNHRWERLEELLRSVEMFLVASRPGYTFPDLLDKLAGTAHLSKLAPLEVPLNGVSSSLIRLRLSQGRNVAYWLPDLVLEYIEQQRLYV